MEQMTITELLSFLETCAADECADLIEKYQLGKLQMVSQVDKQKNSDTDRLLVLATKHCPKNHHDWHEIVAISNRRQTA